jgi:hypothetical protein
MLITPLLIEKLLLEKLFLIYARFCDKIILLYAYFKDMAPRTSSPILHRVWFPEVHQNYLKIESGIPSVSNHGVCKGFINFNHQ